MTGSIVDLGADQVEAAAALLVAGFRHLGSEGWATLDDARREVLESLQPGRISRVALDARGEVVGWIGGIPAYGEIGWELHPLVVAPAHQGRGIGRALVTDLEAQVARRGGLTLFLGTDDHLGQTTLGGIDLYPDVAAHAAAARDVGGHPMAFYQRMGFVVVGVLPDVNGLGKPDIFMAKRMGPAAFGPTN